MTRLPHLLFLTVLTGLGACSTAPSMATEASTPVVAGMTRAQLLAAFGSPFHVQRFADGSEDWSYLFGSAQSTSGPSSSSSSVTGVALPIHLSPAGIVIEPIPQGTVILLPK